MLESSVILAKSLISVPDFSFYKSLSLINITITYLTISHIAVVHQHIFLSSGTYLLRKFLPLKPTVTGQKITYVERITQFL